MPARKGPLAGLVKTLKAEHKAEASPSNTLQKLIDDYCKTEAFDDYLAAHGNDLTHYVDDRSRDRLRFRASAAGKCQQYQAFALLSREAIPFGTPLKKTVERPARQYRALYNGTFMHLRYHLMFDALHAAGVVETYAKEQYLANVKDNSDGTIDRLIGFPYLGKEFIAILDFKSLKHEYFDKLFQPQVDHRLQHHAYKELHYEVFIKPKNIDSWMMLYEDKNDHSLKIYDQPYDEIVTHRIRKMRLQIPEWIEQVKDGVPVDDRLKLPLTVTWCRYCEFQDACLIEHPDLPEKQKTIGDDDDD
jgi:hypothetical protein